MVNPSALINANTRTIYVVYESKMRVDCSFTIIIDIACKRSYCPGAISTTGQQSLATRACLYTKGDVMKTNNCALILSEREKKNKAGLEMTQR